MVIGKKNVKPRQLVFYGTFVAIVISLVLFGLVLLGQEIGLATLSKGMVGVFLFCLLGYVFKRYVNRQRVKYYAEKYKTDLTVISISTFGIVAINLLIYFLTTARPKIWEWYWGNQKFFWAWNVGWLIVAFLSSKHGDDGKIIPVASHVRLLTILALSFGLVINLFFHRVGGEEGNAVSIQPGISPGNAGGKPSEFPTAIADCESGDGTPGSAKQFWPGTKNPVRNPKDGKPGTGAVGESQLNLSDSAVVADLKTLEAEMIADGRLGKDERLDVENNVNHNRAGRDFLYRKYGTAPWTASAGCWADKITAPGGVIVTLKAGVGEPTDPFPLKRGFDFSTTWTGKNMQIYTGWEEVDGVQKPFTKTVIEGPGLPLTEIPGVATSLRVQSLEKSTVIVTVTLTPRRNL